MHSQHPRIHPIRLAAPATATASKPGTLHLPPSAGSTVWASAREYHRRASTSRGCRLRRDGWYRRRVSGNPPGTQSLRYVRVHDGIDGETHFEDVDVELEFAPFAPPAPPIAVSDSLPAAAVVFFGGPENWFGDFHPTPQRQFCMLCEGQLELQTTDGEARRFSPGDLLLLDDLSGRGHISRVVGPSPVAGVFVQLPQSRNSY